MNHSLQNQHAASSPLMLKSLRRLVDAIRGCDWYDDPVERQVFIETIVAEIAAGRATIDPLLSLLDHADRGVSTTIIDLLATIGDPRAVRPLLHVLWERDERTAIYALRQIGTPEAMAAVHEWYRAAYAEIEKLGIFIDISPEDRAMLGEHAQRDGIRRDQQK